MTIITNKYVKNLVDNNDIINLEHYLNQSNENDSGEKLKILTEGTKHMCVAPWVNVNIGIDHNANNTKDQYDLRLYHILSYSTDVSNINIIQHFHNKINLDYSPDGNAYNLLHLAIENYVENYPEQKTKLYDIVILLVKSHLLNQNYLYVGNHLRDLISLGEYYNDYTLLTQLVREYNMNICDVYHYSIAWVIKKYLII